MLSQHMLTSMIEQIQLFFEILRGKWDMLIWESSDEHRAQVRQRLHDHNEAMKNGRPSPYLY